MMIVTDLMSIGVETLMIASECSLEKEFTKDLYKSMNNIIPNYTMSQLCMWYFDLRY